MNKKMISVLVGLLLFGLLIMNSGCLIAVHHIRHNGYYSGGQYYRPYYYQPYYFRPHRPYYRPDPFRSRPYFYYRHRPFCY